MSNFAESHSLPTFKERKKRAVKEKPNKLASEKWLTADYIVDQVYCDFCNGLSSSDIVLKFKEGQYDGQKKGIGHRTALDYIGAAKERMRYDFESLLPQMREDLYTKYVSVFQDCLKNNDRYNALQALNSIAKITGMYDNKSATAIQINGTEDGKVVVNFGFNNDNNEDAG